MTEQDPHILDYRLLASGAAHAALVADKEAVERRIRFVRGQLSLGTAHRDYERLVADLETLTAKLAAAKTVLREARKTHVAAIRAKARKAAPR